MRALRSENREPEHVPRNRRKMGLLGVLLMPYIKKQDRKKYDHLVMKLARILRNQRDKSIDGHVNYIFTYLLMLIYNQAGCRYFDYNRAIGVLESCKLEFYRVVVAPYEDVKIKEHGSV